MKKELTLEHLAPYLPCGLIVRSGRFGRYKMSLSNNMRGSGIEDRTIDMILSNGYMPELHPLSVLEDEDDLIEHNGEKIHVYDVFHQLCSCDAEREFLDAQAGVRSDDKVDYWQYAPYSLIKIACALHLDIFGLIEKGFAIKKS